MRFDGGNKKNDYVVNTLSDFFEWVAVCPEVDIGLGTPRESLRLVGDAAKPALVTGNTNVDHSEKMYTYADKKVRELQTLNLNGYIFKKNSPSCGMKRVRIYHDTGKLSRHGVGIFARTLMQNMPYLPVEEEDRLNDMRLRENFIVRVFCYFRWQKMLEDKYATEKLVQFHNRHTFLIMARSKIHLRALTRLVAEAPTYQTKQLKDAYAQFFFDGLQRKTTPRKHASVLQYILSFFKKQMDAKDKRELLETIKDYRLGLLPLIVPLTLMRHYIHKFDVPYIQDQVYINPHPKELMLLNHL